VTEVNETLPGTIRFLVAEFRSENLIHSA